MDNISKTTIHIEEKRDKLHISLEKFANISNYESLILSKELDEIINKHYKENNPKTSEPICMICGEIMQKKLG